MTKPKPDYVFLAWADDAPLTQDDQPYWSAKEWREDNKKWRSHGSDATVTYRILVRLKPRACQ